MKINSLSITNNNNYVNIQHKPIGFGAMSPDAISDSFEKKPLSCSKDLVFIRNMLRNCRTVQRQIKKAIEKYEQLVLTFQEDLNTLKYSPLSPKLNFSKAESLNFAKEFVNKELKIENFKVNELYTANFIIKALTELSNLAYGNIPTPKTLSIIPMNKNIGGVYSFDDNRISLNADRYNDNFIFGLSCGIVSNNNRECYLEILNRLTRSIFHEIGHCIYFNQLFTNQTNDKIKIIKQLISKTKSEEAVYKELEDLLEKKITILSNSEKLTFYQKIKNFFFGSSNLDKKIMFVNYRLIKIKKDIDDMVNQKDGNVTFDKKIAGKISAYAKENEIEFVAETFAEICMRGIHSISEDVLDMYKKLGGPILQGFYQNLHT